MTKAKKKKQSKPSSRSSRPKRKDLDTSSYEPVEVEAANLKEADFEKIEQAGHVKLDGNARYEINMEIQTMLSMQKIEETAFRREEIRFALESLLKNLSGLYGFLTSKSETAEAKAEDKISDQLCVMNYDGLYKKIDKPKYSKDLNPPMHRLIDGDRVEPRVDLNQFKIDVENILEAVTTVLAGYKAPNADKGGNDTTLSENEFARALLKIFDDAGGDRKYEERFFCKVIELIVQPFRPQISMKEGSTRKYIKRLRKSK